MKTILMNGTKLKNELLKKFKNEVINLKEKGIKPHLCVVQIGQNSSSNIYVSHKEKVAKFLGIEFSWIKFKSDLKFEDLKFEIKKLNENKNITGIIIQFPLPLSYSKSQTANLVDPRKDADGTTDYNQNLIKNKSNTFGPITCTPKGILKLLSKYNISIKGKKTVVLGRSRIVGSPMKTLLENKGASVKIINRETSEKDIKSLVKEADLIISATGAKDIINHKMVKQGVNIIDVGIIRDHNKIRGDLQYKNFIGIANHITPVPGGVGPMTVAMLMSNVIELAKKWGGNA